MGVAWILTRFYRILLFSSVEVRPLSLKTHDYRGVRPDFIRTLTWWAFRPRKKIFSFSPKIPRRHPPGPSPPPLVGEPPVPSWDFQLKTDPLPFLAPRTPPSPPPSRKKIFRNVHQVNQILTGIWFITGSKTAWPLARPTPFTRCRPKPIKGKKQMKVHANFWRKP